MPRTATAEAQNSTGRFASSSLSDENINPPAISDSAPDKPCRCVLRNGDSQTAFTHNSAGMIRVSQATYFL